MAGVSDHSSPTILKNGKDVVKETQNEIKTIQEGLGSIRNIILDKTHEVYQKAYIEADATNNSKMIAVNFAPSTGNITKLHYRLFGIA